MNLYDIDLRTAKELITLMSMTDDIEVCAKNGSIRMIINDMLIKGVDSIDINKNDISTLIHLINKMPDVGKACWILYKTSNLNNIEQSTIYHFAQCLLDMISEKNK